MIFPNCFHFHHKNIKWLSWIQWHCKHQLLRCEWNTQQCWHATWRKRYFVIPIRKELYFVVAMIDISLARCMQRWRSYHGPSGPFWRVEKKSSVFYDIRRKFKKYTMYIVRNSHDLKTPHAFTESKPCKNCLNMLMKFGIRKIVYSQFDGTIVKKR